METIKVFKTELDDLLDHRLTRYDDNGKLILNLNNIVISKDDYTYLENTKFTTKIIGSIYFNKTIPHYRR